MIKVENIEVFNFENAIRGCRNPMNSWDRSDSTYVDCDALDCCDCIYCVAGECREYNKLIQGYKIGKNDLDLMRRLYKGGTEHRKYLRQVFVTFDLLAPLYFYKEFDTYRIGVTSNSCSTMHKIHSKEFTLDDFSTEHLTPPALDCLKKTINIMNYYRSCFNELENVSAEEHKRFWWQMIQLLPSSYNQRRTITMNYENVMAMINQREHHKLDEWQEFVKILRSLPYVEEIRGE